MQVQSATTPAPHLNNPPPFALTGEPVLSDDKASTTNGATKTDGPKNLAPVIAIIPKECYENPVSTGLLYIARDFAVYGAILAGLALTDAWYLLIPLWILSAFIISGMFILGHDAAHGALFKSDRMNAVWGRILMLPSLHVFESWVFGHNRLHHGHTVRQGADFVWHPITPQDWAKMSTVERLVVRAEWSFIGAGLYYGRNIWLNMMRYKQPDSLAKKIHRDQFYVWSFIVGGGLLFGMIGYAHYGTALGALWMFIKLLVVPAMAFLHTIGAVVYMHHIEPDIHWWPRGSWDKFKGQMEGTTIKTMPFWADFFFHNIMVHVPHHVDMRIPFYHLPKAAEAIVQAFPDVVRVEKLSLIGYLRDTQRCKLYDFEKRTWLPYPSA